MPARLIGKTIASVSSKELSAQDAYDDSLAISLVTFTCTDGTVVELNQFDGDFFEREPGSGENDE